jgi:hypothetical protein
MDGRRVRNGEGSGTQHIRVATFDGSGSEAPPVIRTVPRPGVPAKAALFMVGGCGVCGTDLHILAGHWPKPLPWPSTLGREIAGVIDEIGPELSEDYMGNPLEVGAKIMIPPLMPCGSCCYCRHYPNTANKCLTPVYYGRYLGFDKAPHFWGGWAEMQYLDLGIAARPQGVPSAGRPAALARHDGRAVDLLHARVQAGAGCGWVPGRGHRRDPGVRPHRRAGNRSGKGDWVPAAWW